MTESNQQPLMKSSRKRRIVAFMIDHFVLSVINVSLIFLILGPNFTDEEDAGKLMIAIFTVIPIGMFIYFAKDNIKGMSLGKWIMGIMVRDADDNTITPSFGRLLLRNLLLIILPVEFIVLAASNDKRRLGDKAARAVVVKNPNKASKSMRIVILLLVIIGTCTFVFLQSSYTIKNSEAYKTAIQEIDQNQEISTATGGVVGYGMVPTGEINIRNGKGIANLKIKVKGKKKDKEVQVYLEKEQGGKWEMIELYQE
ncbi:RDD family protein [Flavobacterium sp. '19STA2R22 D10 B1']|uniref:RDD family protein n=1 Tax=Flavobacterium aerium TaxID=3037261 RepID=UPI00278BD309|nr:cytochrome c oxidase assembly factor Coa1 family protein [Flavobacterium sp. '19STA2R22 D10 B1']